MSIDKRTPSRNAINGRPANLDVLTINERLADLNIFTVRSPVYGKKALYREGEFLGLFTAHEACNLIRSLEA